MSLTFSVRVSVYFSQSVFVFVSFCHPFVSASLFFSVYFVSISVSLLSECLCLSLFLSLSLRIFLSGSVSTYPFSLWEDGSLLCLYSPRVYSRLYFSLSYSRSRVRVSLGPPGILVGVCPRRVGHTEWDRSRNPLVNPGNGLWGTGVLSPAVTGVTSTLGSRTSWPITQNTTLLLT